MHGSVSGNDEWRVLVDGGSERCQIVVTIIVKLASQLMNSDEFASMPSEIELTRMQTRFLVDLTKLGSNQ